MMQDPPVLNSVQFIQQHADQCVKCGLCLPHCPTYVKTRNENESPRGRLALLQALAEGQLDVRPQLVAHLESCLVCSSCERVCPSGVKYVQIFRTAQTFLPSHKGIATRLGLGILTRPRRLDRIAVLLRVYQLSGMQALLRSSRLFKRMGLIRLQRLERLLPPLHFNPVLHPFYPATDTDKGRGSVALFSGCISRIADRATLDASIALLNRLGYDVHIPDGQVCCGALHQSNGDINAAMALARQNLDCFSAHEYDAVLFNASGCGAHLQGYSGLDWPDSKQEQLDQLTHRLQDVTQFLAGQEWPETLELKPLYKRIAVHEACTARNVLRNQGSIYRLLSRIPHADIVPLGSNNQCCGAAGSYMLHHPDMAEALKADKLDDIDSTHAELLATTNLGCALHLLADLQQQTPAVTAVHPVQLIYQQLK